MIDEFIEKVFRNLFQNYNKSILEIIELRKETVWLTNIICKSDGKFRFRVNYYHPDKIIWHFSSPVRFKNGRWEVFVTDYKGGTQNERYLGDWLKDRIKI
jgi:hypothetical protein